MVPWSAGENYSINGQTYCYDQGPKHLNFTRGPCGVTEPTDTMIKTGLIMAGAGGVMALLGWRRVAVNPTINTSAVGMSATVKW